ncbi:dockerin type I domain-containing protein, partial [Desulfobacterota bacterium AH_259_B03_O07]|nr:dockerin type I domain-containing protein [Desulfobacterota bacterium AH_259_B03_O07]
VGANDLGPEDSSAVQFVDAGEFDYNLPAGSQCNTAGVKDTLGGEAPFPPTDYKGVMRDASIGAAENPTTTPAPTPTPGGPCSGSACEPGDANADGFVNLADLGVIIEIFRGNQTGPGNGDCNEDGFTNLADLGCVITKFRG